MAYADKCFYFDWGDREIKLEDYLMEQRGVSDWKGKNGK